MGRAERHGRGSLGASWSPRGVSRLAPRARERRMSSLSESRELLEGQVREHFGPHVAACETLLDLARELLEPEEWRGRPMREDARGGMHADRLLAMEIARSLNNYRGAIDAALGGYGPQAMMVGRALFEEMAVAYWVRANPEL